MRPQVSYPELWKTLSLKGLEIRGSARISTHFPPGFPRGSAQRTEGRRCGRVQEGGLEGVMPGPGGGEHPAVVRAQRHRASGPRGATGRRGDGATAISGLKPAIVSCSTGRSTPARRSSSSSTTRRTWRTRTGSSTSGPAPAAMCAGNRRASVGGNGAGTPGRPRSASRARPAAGQRRRRQGDRLEAHQANGVPVPQRGQRHDAGIEHELCSALREE